MASNAENVFIWWRHHDTLPVLVWQIHFLCFLILPEQNGWHLTDSINCDNDKYWFKMLSSNIKYRRAYFPHYFFSIKINPLIRVCSLSTAEHCLSQWEKLLTHWGQVTHICVSKLTIVGSDNGLLPDWFQTIIWTSVAILLIGPLETNFSEILIEILTLSFKKMHLKKSSGKWWPFVSATMC